LWVINNIYFQYFSVLITIVSAVVMVVVSYASEAPPHEQIEGLTFATTTEQQRAVTWASWNKWDVLGSLVVFLAILGAYLYFRG
jgi:SSS family solute:Na+ symporter